MKKKNTVRRLTKLALSVALLTAGTAQAGWLTAYGTPNNDMGKATPSAQGGYYVTLLSSGSLSGFPGAVDTASNMLAGITTKPAQLLSLLAADGTPLWTNKISTGAYDAFSATELADGRLLVQGTTQTKLTASGDAVWAVYQVNRATGKLTPLFRNVYKGKGADYLFINQDALGALWAQGTTTSFNTKGDTDMIVAKINANTGAPEWSSVLNYAHNNAVAAFTPKGNQFILVANAGNAGNWNVVIGLLDNHGLPVAGSFNKYGASGINNAQGLKAIGNDNYLLYGTTTVNTPDSFGIPHKNSTVFVVKLDADLNIVWDKKYSVGQDAGFTITEVNENSDGSFTLNGSVNAMTYYTMQGFSVPLYALHPAAIQLSATGGALFGKSFELNTMDPAFFFKNADGTYSLSGQTSKINLTNPTANLNGDSDLLYGAFDADFAPSWVKTLGGTAIDSGSVKPIAGGYGLTGMSASWGAGKLDVLVGELDGNGNIAGCEGIKDAVMTEKTLTVSADDLGWTPQAVKLARKGAINKANITQLNVSTSPTITATPVCSD
ncbi:MAG: hypothetical protein QX199_17100 [Methylococcaceae bacterium]